MSVIAKVLMVLSDHQFVGKVAGVDGTGARLPGIELTPEAGVYLAHLAEIGVERAIEVLALLGA